MSSDRRLCLHLSTHLGESHLDEHVEAQIVDVVDVAQSEQAGEQAAGQHAHGEVQSDGQALPDDATAWAHNDDITLTTTTHNESVSARRSYGLCRPKQVAVTN